MPTSTKEALIAANERLRQDNLELQQQLDEMTHRYENTATLFTRCLNALEECERIIATAKSQYTPTSDGSGRSEEAGW